MRAIKTIRMLAIALAIAGCGGGDPEPEKETMQVEDTVFGDLIGTQDKARERTNAAMEAHRDALESQLEADEGAPPEE